MILHVFENPGHGNDARNLNHKTVRVQKVERLENYELFEKYRVHRKQMLNRMYKDSQTAPDISGIRSKVENNMQSSGSVATTPLLDSFMKTELLHAEINEHFLFHGCKVRFHWKPPFYFQMYQRNKKLIVKTLKVKKSMYVFILCLCLSVAPLQTSFFNDIFVIDTCEYATNKICHVF